MRRWEIDQRLRERFQRDAEVERGAAGTVITISRQWGSGGTSIASLVAKELGFVLYDREIIDQVAAASGASPDVIARRDERLEGVVSDVVLHLLHGKHPTESGYLRALVRVMRDIAMQGNAVIVGRGGAYILPHSYRVRVIAPELVRIARIAELHRVDEHTARKMVVDSDRQRYSFARGLFGCDPADPLNYDLVINTERCSIEQGARLVVQGFTQSREGGVSQ